MLAHQIEEPVRDIIHRTRGSIGGPITRLVSPSDLGEVIKPFVFLDRFDFAGYDTPMSMEHGWHPHSGIATVTVVLPTPPPAWPRPGVRSERPRRTIAGGRHALFLRRLRRRVFDRR